MKNKYSIEDKIKHYTAAAESLNGDLEWAYAQIRKYPLTRGLYIEDIEIWTKDLEFTLRRLEALDKILLRKQVREFIEKARK